MFQTTVEPASMMTINMQCLDESETSRQNTLRAQSAYRGTVNHAKKAVLSYICNDICQLLFLDFSTKNVCTTNNALH